MDFSMNLGAIAKRSIVFHKLSTSFFVQRTFGKRHDEEASDDSENVS